MAVSTGAAILGGVVAGSSILGAKKAADASKDATKAQTAAADASVAEQQRQFDITQESLQPSIEAGNLARDQQVSLLGLGGTEAQQTAYDSLTQSPGQQFLQARAQKNLLNNAAAIGGLGGGNVRNALVQQGVGFAQTDLDNQFSRLGQLAGQGQAATTSVGQFGQSTSNNISNALIASGDARATGIANQNAAFQSGLSGVTTGLGQSGLFSNTGNQFNTIGGQSASTVPAWTPLG